jgi:hypothetical protein
MTVVLHFNDGRRVVESRVRSVEHAWDSEGFKLQYEQDDKADAEFQAVWVEVYP